MGRLIRATIGAFLLLIVAAAVGAVAARKRMVSVGTPESDEIGLVGIFDEASLTSTASSFRGGSMTDWFGGGDLDLRGATLDPDGARLTVRAIFGGGRIIVPDDWTVDVDVLPLFGGMSDTRETLEVRAGAPRLQIDGFVLFGGYAIVSATDEDLAAV
jgi:predicted membrane protein